MDKYIKYEDLKDYLNRQIQAFEPCPDKYDAAVGIYNGLYQIPVADVALVRHGRWIELENGDCKCSLCGCYHDAWEAYGYYCQHCGAKMDKENGNNG